MKTAIVNSKHNSTVVVPQSYNQLAPLMTEDYKGDSNGDSSTTTHDPMIIISMKDNNSNNINSNNTTTSKGFAPISDDYCPQQSQLHNDALSSSNGKGHSNGNSANGSDSGSQSPAKPPSPVQLPDSPSSQQQQQLINSTIQSLKDVPLAPELCELFSCFRRYKAAISGKREDELSKYQAKVNELFKLDYHVSLINNKAGELCATYPPELIVIEAEREVKCKGCIERDVKPINNSQAMHKVLSSSRFARVRTRFPFPVIYYHNKNLCRSSTLSKKIEYMFQTGVNSMKKQFGTNGAQMEEVENGDTQNMENLRNNDISAIKHLSVKYICDLMVENKKKKFGFYVCSSEKADIHDRYTKQFVIASTPYPGVEFFSLFNQNRHDAKDLFYGWDFTEYPAELKVDKNSVPVIWEQYKSWDLLNLTQNYLKLLLEYISDDTRDSGVLVHCISGWDRTPLFISLLRLSLWADGEIHQSLKPSEILYLTVAYDWFLFSHQLADRAGRGEDIFYFCFYFLEYITSYDFSVHAYSHLKRDHHNHTDNNNNNNNVNNNSNHVHTNGLKNKSNSQSSSSSPSPSHSPAPVTTKESRSNSNENRLHIGFNGTATPTSLLISKQSFKTPGGSTIFNSYGKGSSPLVDTQSAPPTPKKNSPSSFVPVKFPNLSSAPSTPLSHSPIASSMMMMGEHRLSPNLTSISATPPSALTHTKTGGMSIPVDVPRQRHPYSQQSYQKDAEELGGSWQMMGSLQDKMKSLSSFGSTPKFMHPSGGSFSSNSEAEEMDETNSKTVSDEEDDMVHDPMNTWDPFLVDPNASDTDSNVSSGGFNKRIKQDGSNGSHVRSDESNNHSQDKLPRKEHKEPHHNYTHHHSNNSNLSREEIEDRRRERLMAVKSLFITLYQQCCLETNDSYWKTILTYLPKFG